MANAMLSVSYNTKPPRVHKSSNLVQGLVDENRVCTVGKFVDNNSHYGGLNGHDRRLNLIFLIAVGSSMILLRSVVSKEPALLFMFWRFILEKLALLDLLTHVRNVFSGLVLAGTLLRMEQPPTVVVVDRRGRCFDFWDSLHHQQFQNRNKHEKNKFSKQSLAVSPCPTSSGLDACHRFLEKTTCADGRCLPVSLSLRAVLCFGLCNVFFELFWAL